MIFFAQCFHLQTNTFLIKKPAGQSQVFLLQMCVLQVVQLIKFNSPWFSERTRLPGYFRRIQAMLAPQKAVGSSINSNSPRGVAQIVHTLIEHRAGALAESVWSLNSSLVNIYFRFSEFQSSLLLIYFRDGPNRCSHCTKLWYRTYPICDAPLSKSARRIFAPSQKSRRHNRSCL